MEQSLTAERTIMIHDFDGVQYSDPEHLDVTDFYGNIKAKVTENLFPELTFDERKSLGQRSYRTTGNGFKLFIERGVEQGMDRGFVEDYIYEHYHTLARTAMRRESENLFDPCVTTNLQFDCLRGHVRHGVLTQSSIDHWVKPNLASMNRLAYFEQDWLIGAQDFGGTYSKALHTKPMEYAIERTGAKPEQIIFAEDSIVNLAVAKKFDPRIFTLLICPVPPPVKPAFVDLQVPNLAQGLQLVSNALKTFSTSCQLQNGMSHAPNP